MQESSFTKLLRKTERNRPKKKKNESTHDARIAHESKTIHEGKKSAFFTKSKREEDKDISSLEIELRVIKVDELDTLRD